MSDEASYTEILKVPHTRSYADNRSGPSNTATTRSAVQGGDFQMATSGYFYMATNGDFLMAMDKRMDRW